MNDAIPQETNDSDSMMENMAVPSVGVSDTLHIGAEDLPWVDVGDGSEVQLLHADLAQGLWITRTRFAPGTTLPRHYHTGMVYAVTLSGKWWYLETPEQVNSEGSYLFEPAMSVHTLTVDASTTESTEVWFAIYGVNVNLDDDGQVISILDAATVLDVYRQGCTAQGLSYDSMIVVGENLTLGA